MTCAKVARPLRHCWWPSVRRVFAASASSFLKTFHPILSTVCTICWHKMIRTRPIRVTMPCFADW